MIRLKIVLLVIIFSMAGFAQEGNEWELAQDFPVLKDLWGVGRGEIIPGFGGIKKNYPLKHNPIIFIHGNGGNHTNFIELAKLFKKSGYSHQELWGFSYMGFPSKMNAKGDPHSREIKDIKQIIQTVLDYTGAKKIDIVAHSLGVSLSLYWMEQTQSYAKVDRLVMIAGAPNGFPNVAPSSEWRKVWMDENIRLDGDQTPFGVKKDKTAHRAPEKNKRITYIIVYAGKDDRILNLFGENSESSFLDGSDAVYNFQGKLNLSEHASEMEKACGIHCALILQPEKTFQAIKKHFGIK